MSIFRADILRTTAFGSITGTYSIVGPSVTHNLRIFRITNTTDADLILSFDGVNDNLFIPQGSFVLYDLSANAPPTNLIMSIGTVFYIKYNSGAPTSGGVWIEGIYAKGE